MQSIQTNFKRTLGLVSLILCAVLFLQACSVTQPETYAPKRGQNGKDVMWLPTGDDLIVKSKGIKDIEIPWKKVMVNYFEVKEQYKTFKPRKPKAPVLWHNPFGIKAA